MEKKIYAVHLQKEAYKILSTNAEALNVPIVKLLPALISCLEQDEFKVEVINKLLQG